jgi:KDO2-lipid IV(A) lauroyltransferase
MRERLALQGYLVAWRAVRLLPEPLAYGLFALIADFVWWRHGPAVRRLEANLTRAVPGAGPEELRRISRRGMRSYLRYWCDAFRLPSWSHERIVSTCRLVDDERVRPYFESSDGVVVAMSHQGNWDHAGAWSTTELSKVTTVAERLKPEELFDRFVAYREQLGMEILPLTGGRNVFGTLMRRVKNGGFVPLLCERDLTDQGVPVTFLGEATRWAAGPAALAIATKAPLIPLNVWYERLPRGSRARWGVVLKTYPPVPRPATGSRAEQIRIMTQGCADAIGTGIAEHPEDWHMLQRVFEADLEPRPDRVAASGSAAG